MRKTAFVLSLVFQFILTFVFLFIVYIIYALLDVEEADMMNGIGFIVFQPLFGFILTTITVIICFIAGLPIRLKTKMKLWWLTKPLIPILGFAIGVLLLILAFNPNLTETKQIILNGETVNKEVPNITVSITGWFLTAFCLLHFYPQSLLMLFRKQAAKTIIK